MEKINTVLRKKGIKVTPQRLHVYSVFRKTDKHLSVDDVFKAVKKKLPAISRGTVYTTLECFRHHGLLKEIHIDLERILYEQRVDGHHHFFCNACKHIYDIEITLCSTLKKMNADGHIINDFHGYFYGTCRTCNEK